MSKLRVSTGESSADHYSVGIGTLYAVEGFLEVELEPVAEDLTEEAKAELEAANLAARRLLEAIAEQFSLGHPELVESEPTPDVAPSPPASTKKAAAPAPAEPTQES